MEATSLDRMKRTIEALGGKVERLPVIGIVEPKVSPSKRRRKEERQTQPKEQTKRQTPKVVSTERSKRLAEVRGDKLGEFVAKHTKWYSELPWREFVRRVRGPGDLRVQKEVRSSHPAGDLLHRLERNGVPVVMRSKPWDQRTKDERSKRGSHRSCDDHLDFLREEILEFVEKGFWVLLPYRVIKHLAALRLSPMGVVPQRGRRPRLIVDYSFYDLNQDTVRMMPAEAMQFGRALERILYQIRHANPKFGHVHLGKVDLADGFYRLRLADGSILKLGVAFPKYEGEEQMVALPLSIPMGWVESPPAFCAATETVADVANNMHPQMHWPEHPLEQMAWTPPEEDLEDVKIEEGSKAPSVPAVHKTIPPVLRPLRKPVSFYDIYVDDFLLGFQGSTRRKRKHLRRLLHAIDLVFRPLEPHDRPTRKHVPSVKKLLKGDAYLSVTKVVLGWLINTAAGTIELPPHRQERLMNIFQYLSKRSRVPERKWHKILGELRSMVIGIPGSRGLFSMLQLALQKVDTKGNITLDAATRDQIKDLHHLAQDLTSRPTAIAELVPDFPVALGPHDASGSGMGGVWLPATTNSNIQPILWRTRFPPHIVQDLVSFDNPTGSINNSQLELAGQIAHQDILAQTVDCAYRTIAPLGDNTSAVSWSHKGSVTTMGPTAYLLRLNSLHQRHFRYLSKPDYIPGVFNRMADDLSRLWHLSDSQLLLYFNSKYPQAQPWRIAVLRPEMLSSLISALRMTRVEPQSVLNEPPLKTAIGANGQPTATPLTLTPTFKPTPTSFLFSKFLPFDYEAASSLPVGTASALGRWRTTYGIKQLQSAWSKEDPPPERVKPIPLQLIRHVVNRLDLSDPFESAKADALIIGFFYMLRPGEHTWDSKNNHPFRFCDTSFSLGDGPAANGATIPDATLAAATRVFLNFTTQKNGERDEAITHGDTSHPILSPVAAVRRRVQHLRRHNAPPATPLYTVFMPHGTTKNILSSHLTQELRTSCAAIGHSLGLHSREISARALRAGGAMALIRAKIDPSLVKLMGRWKSDIMLRYLHRSALHTADFASAMLQFGEFVIPRHAKLPPDAQHLLDSVHTTPLAA